ncbi:hypothetical protein ABVT39_013066 [Epinephelus coioides]
MVYIRDHTEVEEGEVTMDTSSASDEDFFSTMKPKNADELDGYLAYSSEKMDLLRSFPALKKLSIKTNTALPASAACEQLFSCAGFIFTSRRARLGNKNFENQLLLKLNKKFIK